MGDELIDQKDEQTMSREAAAERLREIADQLSRHNQIEVDLGGLKSVVKVPAEVTLSLEVELDEDGGGEIEVEISW
jgi:amphi-Trp domain-containing protein